MTTPPPPSTHTPRRNPITKTGCLALGLLGLVLVVILAALGVPVVAVLPLLLFALPLFIPAYTARKRQHPHRAAIYILTSVTFLFALFFLGGVVSAIVTPDFFGQSHVNPIAWVCAFVAFFCWLAALIWSLSYRPSLDILAGTGRSASPLSTASAEERLRSLTDLHTRGIISLEELETKRQEILKSL